MDTPPELGIGGLPMRRDLLDAGQDAFQSGATFRARRTRARNYYRGKQLEDRVRDPDTGLWTTEGELIASQNRTPISNNEIGVMVRNLKGTLALNTSQPNAFAADRDDPDVAPMMNAALKGIFRINKMSRLGAAQFEESILCGRQVYRVTFARHPKTGKSDVCIDPVSPARFFHNSDAADPRGFDVRMVGEVCDMAYDDAVMAFCVDPATGEYDAARAKGLAQAYGSTAQRRYQAADQTAGFARVDSLSYLVPSSQNSCRVIWVWVKEYGARAYIEDDATGEVGDDAIPFTDVVPGEDPFVGAQNAAEMEGMARLEQYNAEMQSFELQAAQGVGYLVDEAGEMQPLVPPMEPEEVRAVQRYESVWTGYALTPGGEVLWNGAAPWLHGEHPYCWGDTVRIDGETWGLIEDVIDPQRMYNRINSVVDFMFGAGSKGAVAYDATMVDGEEVSDADVNEVYSSAGRAIGIKPGAGKTVRDFWGQAPASPVPAWAIEWMDRYAERIKTQGGVNPASLGDVPPGDTSGFSYQLQQIAASTNTRDLFDAHFDVRESVTVKAMQLVEQYYDEPRQLRISPNKPPIFFDPARVRDVEWDLLPGDVAETATSQLVLERDLQEFWTAGGITFEEFLEVSGNPAAPQLIALIQQRQPEILGMPAGAAGPDMLAAAGAAGVPGAAPPGAAPPGVAPPGAAGGAAPTQPQPAAALA